MHAVVLLALHCAPLEIWYKMPVSLYMYNVVYAQLFRISVAILVSNQHLLVVVYGTTP